VSSPRLGPQNKPSKKQREAVTKRISASRCFLLGLFCVPEHRHVRSKCRLTFNDKILQLMKPYKIYIIGGCFSVGLAAWNLRHPAAPWSAETINLWSQTDVISAHISHNQTRRKFPLYLLSPFNNSSVQHVI
jgi:hypothetical protein